MKSATFSIAVVATAYTPNSHADVIVRRWVAPLSTDELYGWDGPRTKIASLYTDQRGEDDLSAQVCGPHGIRVCQSVEEALTLGTGRLAVNAVMIIGEHGDYPLNEFQQKLYPRKELLDAVLGVFDRCGQTAPLFFDKHLSWSVPCAREMYADLQGRGIRWFGGSSLAFCPQLPPPGDLGGAVFREVVATTWGALEPYLFHALEGLETVVEQRSGGETGILSVLAWTGESAWKAVDRGEFSYDLLEAAAAAAGDEASLALRGWNERRDKPLEVIQLRYRDGLKASIVSLRDTLRKWAYGCRLDGRDEIVAAAFATGNGEHGYSHFARLARQIEDFFLSGVSPVPNTRLYFTTLACAYGMQAVARPGKPLPESDIVLPPQLPPARAAFL